MFTYNQTIKTLEMGGVLGRSTVFNLVLQHFLINKTRGDEFVCVFFSALPRCTPNKIGKGSDVFFFAGYTALCG